MDKKDYFQNIQAIQNRSIPFWSWNDTLDETELIRQIEQMDRLGIGGFVIHARSGLKTEYLSEKWFHCVGVCIAEAKKRKMQVWLYDENGWPSGFCGMKLLEKREYWIHELKYEQKDRFDPDAFAVFVRTDGGFRRVDAEDAQATRYFCVYDTQSGSYVDILNPDVVDDFIRGTHEEYRKRFAFDETLRGFFTDEPQYDRWGYPYSPMVRARLIADFGYEIRDKLIYLFEDGDEAKKVRHDYYKTMNRLFIENYIKKIYEWCDKNGCQITGHAIDETSLYGQVMCCGGVMPFYLYEQFPAIDWLGRDIGGDLAAKQVDSVACQTGRKYVLSEMFACSGWDATPKELKQIAEFQFAEGVNTICQHLYAYSIRGVRKHDHPPFFSYHNPVTPYMRKFYDYFSRLGKLLADSREQVRCLVIHPLHSAYMVFHREKPDDIDRMDRSFAALLKALGDNFIGYHLGDEMIMERIGRVEGDKIVFGECAYDTVILPNLLTLDTATARMLTQFLENGGKLVYDVLPAYMDGEPCEYSDWPRRCSIEEFIAREGLALDGAGDFRGRRMDTPFGTADFIVNIAGKEAELRVKVPSGEVAMFDLMSMEERDYSGYVSGGVLRLRLQDKQSAVLVYGRRGEMRAKEYEFAEEIVPDCVKIDTPYNYLALDYVSYETENGARSGEMPVSKAFQNLAELRKKQRVKLFARFEAREVPRSLYLISEPYGVPVYINGQPAVRADKKFFEKKFDVYDIAFGVKQGMNEISLVFDYVQSEHVYHVLLDDGVTESLRNALSLDTEMDCFYLAGDFGVFGAEPYFADQGTLVQGGGFYLSRRPERIDLRDLVRGGFPFYAGELTFETKFRAENTNLALCMEGRFAAYEAWVNGKYAGSVVLEEALDIGPYVKRGDNTLIVRVVFSNRNLFGPHHSAEREAKCIWPAYFGDGVWDKRTVFSTKWTDEYSFIPFGVSKINLKKVLF